MKTYHYPLRLAAFCFLAAALIALGHFMIPAHWTSLWNDREFTDWISPIANELQGQSRLYEYGLHSPMPPLSFVLVRALCPHGAVWLDESRLNFTFQAGMILLLYWAFSKDLGPGVAVTAALASVPLFLSLPKTILYDSMAQFLVAAAGVITAAIIRRERAGGPRAFSLAQPALVGGAGLVLGLLLLTKQTTAAGAILGVGAVLLILPRSANLRQRLRLTAGVMGFTLLAFCLVAFACHRYLSFSGMIHDVFLTGSEPKGGLLRLLRNFAVYAFQIGLGVVALFSLACILQACLGGRFTPFTPATVWQGAPNCAAGNAGPAYSELVFVLTAFAASATGLLAMLFWLKAGSKIPSQVFPTLWGEILLNLGLIPCLVLCGALIFKKPTAPECAAIGPSPLAPYALIFFGSAVFHNLSVNSWHWTYYNNPLVLLALLFAAGSFLSPAPPAGSPALRPVGLGALIIAFVILAMWPQTKEQLSAVLGSTEPWPEVKHLAGARLRPDSDGMRALVQTVRSLIPADSSETILLLPNDPNVSAWFERPAPRLSSAIIFTDQYWDRYVNQDFAELEAHPPGVIVIGPRDSWRSFSQKWNNGRGAERLMDLVQNRLLPAGYKHQAEQLILYQGRQDFMDVYVRRAP